MKKIYKETKSNYGGHLWMCPIFVPSSKRDKKTITTKYSNMDGYGTIQLRDCNEYEKKLIVRAFILHYLDSEVLFLENGSFTTPTNFVLNIDKDGDVYIETDNWSVGLERTPSNECFFLADYINRPRKLRRVLDQQYSDDERRRWKEIIRYYRHWVKQSDAIVIE